MNHSTINTELNLENSYAEQLKDFYVFFHGDKAPAPELLRFNKPLANQLGLELSNIQEQDIAHIFSGGVTPTGTTPLAQVYAGHQFGGFSPQLGDGRALLLGEIIDKKGQRFDIHLKGSGRTPYSRGGDGKATLGPVLREYLLGEAMHALNIPTTRALAAVITGETVMRDRLLPGAVLARIAKSHIRVGTFEYFASRKDTDKLKQLADYTIRRHYPELESTDTPYLDLLKAVSQRQASLIAQWMGVGFVHGVMNTDNMTVAGETIDYGPCAFIDNYDTATVFSSIDKQGRYAYGNQASIGQWNLTRFAETLLPLISSDINGAIELASQELNSYPDNYKHAWLKGMRNKLGLTTQEAEDLALVSDLLNTMQAQNVDYTQLFRALSLAAQGYTDNARNLFDEPEQFDMWFERWHDRLTREPFDTEARITNMNSVNPIYIPRNHKVQEALDAAENEANYAPFEELLCVLAEPFNERKELAAYAKPPPDDFGHYKTFCGT